MISWPNMPEPAAMPPWLRTSAPAASGTTIRINVPARRPAIAEPFTRIRCDTTNEIRAAPQQIAAAIALTSGAGWFGSREAINATANKATIVVIVSTAQADQRPNVGRGATAGGIGWQLLAHWSSVLAESFRSLALSEGFFDGVLRGDDAFCAAFDVAAVEVIEIKCHIPPTRPSPKPTIIKIGLVPQRSSSHLPPSPGNTISKPTVTIRDTHSIAKAIGGLWSGGGGTATAAVVSMEFQGGRKC